jgi:hypothetical protein
MYVLISKFMMGVRSRGPDLSTQFITLNPVFSILLSVYSAFVKSSPNFTVNPHGVFVRLRRAVREAESFLSNSDSGGKPTNNV